MSAKVFFLGRPGSGKSTAARWVKCHLTQKGWTSRHINDYEILQRMFLADTQQVRFRPTEHNGFDAIDLTVMDTALQEVEAEVCACLPFVDLVTIEFARNDYREALQQFTPSFLRDAHFLFLDTDIETCLCRVHERVIRSHSSDDHPSFSDVIFKNYYSKENGAYMNAYMQRDFNLANQVRVINNIGSLEHFIHYIEMFAEEIFTQKSNEIALAGQHSYTGLLID